MLIKAERLVRLSRRAPGTPGKKIAKERRVDFVREIEFRGKTSDGKWEYGGVVINPRGQWFITTFIGGNDVDPETVGQYIGLKDRNGKKVFEGDIVSVWRDGSNRIFVVKWRETGVPMYILYPQPLNENFWHCRSDMEMAWEVIGNIYDNPELVAQ
jgi:hypothetical protein